MYLSGLARSARNWWCGGTLRHFFRTRFPKVMPILINHVVSSSTADSEAFHVVNYIAVRTGHLQLWHSHYHSSGSLGRKGTA